MPSSLFYIPPGKVRQAGPHHHSKNLEYHKGPGKMRIAKDHYNKLSKCGMPFGVFEFGCGGEQTTISCPKNGREKLIFYFKLHNLTREIRGREVIQELEGETGVVCNLGMAEQTLK